MHATTMMTITGPLIFCTGWRCPASSATRRGATGCWGVVGGPGVAATCSGGLADWRACRGYGFITVDYAEVAHPFHSKSNTVTAEAERVGAKRRACA